ncbi:MAG TPA: O-antigen ligase family protein, partial [Blastocatellia bacterium]|nr:O-antigen ligase family protein [Blastocatellia bacterium]
VIAFNFIASRERLRAVVGFLIIYGLAMAVFALVQHFTWNGHIYWLRPLTAQSATPFGPFVNRNHFAGYMVLLMPVPIGLLITGAANRDSRLFYGFAATMMALAAVASLSRGGIISLIAELIFLTAMSLKRKDQPAAGRLMPALRPLAFAPLIAGAIIAGVFWIGSEPVVNRMIRSGIVGEDPKAQTFFSSRGWIWRDTVAMIGAKPLMGVGLGAYETAYPIYSQDDGTITLGQPYSVDRAHNDYLQVLADCGIVGLGIALWFILTLFRGIARGARSRDPFFSGLALGCGAGVFGLLVHSLFDFNLQIPSNALLFILLTAVISHTAGVETGPERKRRDVLKRGARIDAASIRTGVAS